MQTSSAGDTGDFRDVTVNVDGKRLNARVAGTGTPIVLFHSLLADQTSFEPVASMLAKTHQVVLLNLPGFGSSDAVGNSLEAIADHIAAGIEALGLGRKPILLGNGYGGFVALLTAIRHPGLATRLVLADCGAMFSEPGRAAFRGMSTTAREKGLGAIADVAMRRLFAPEFQQANPALIEERKKRFLAVDPKTFHGACDALATLDVREQLKAVTVPVLVLVGEQDEATPPRMSRELAAGLPDAKLVVLPGCAHVPQLQAPGQFMEAIRSFIAAAPSPVRGQP
jgi:3-oxoadipate enol-lactonase